MWRDSRRCGRSGVNSWKTSDSDCVFLTWEWLYTWWKHLAGDRQLSILVVRRGEWLVALAPFCLRPARLLQPAPTSGDGVSRNGMRRLRLSGFHYPAGTRSGSPPGFRGMFGEAGAGARLDATTAREAVRPPESRRTWRKGVGPPQRRCLTHALLFRWQGCPGRPIWPRWDAEHRYNFNRKWKHINRDYSCAVRAGRDRGGMPRIDRPGHGTAQFALARSWWLQRLSHPQCWLGSITKSRASRLSADGCGCMCCV